MNGMPVTMLDGFGCPDCGGGCNKPALMGMRTRFNGLGAVSNYDKITVGGSTYTANQLLDKTVIAKVDTKVYSNASGKGTVVAVIKAGQPIGKVYSYLRPDQKSTDGRGWLMFESSYNKFYYAPNEAVSSVGLKDQGTLTVTEELKKEEEQKLKDESPIEYYIKKYAGKVLLIGGAIYIGSVIVREGFKAATKKKDTTEPATT